MRQSSHLLPALPACATLLALTLGPGAALLSAQQEFRVLRTENFRREPSGNAALLATVNAGVELPADSVMNQWVRLVLEGWVWAQSLAPTTQPGFDLRVSPGRGENVRIAPNGRVLGRLAEGCLLVELDREPGWVRVRRVAWMFRGSVAPVGAATRPAAPATAPATSSAQIGLDWAVTADRAALHRTPDGDSAGTLAPDASVRVLARSGEWVRVQTEGWVRESDLRPSSSGVLVGVSGAEVRSSPREFEGALLQWVVQYIAIQSADELRREIPEGQRYVLARGPLPEAGFVYIVLDDAQLTEIERLEPLTELVVIGRVRTARSQYLGNPILDLVDLAVRR
jgi:hypothetical protein